MGILCVVYNYNMDGKMKEIIKVINLSYQDHISDKVYETEIIETGPGKYKVKYKYGRRYAVNNTRFVPKRSVNIGEAIFIRDKQVVKKINKGYVIDSKY